MKIIPVKKDKYLEVCSLIKELKKEGFFDIFANNNLFIISDGKNEYAISSVLSGEKKSTGIAFFVGKEGYNTLHDIYSSNANETPQINEYNMMSVLLVDKDYLFADEVNFLKKIDINLKARNNIIIRTYKTGIAPYISTSNDASIIIELLSFLLLIIRNDKDSLIEGFNNNKAGYMTVNYRKHIYTLDMINIPYLEREYAKVNTNDLELNEFIGYNHNDYEGELLINNLEVPIKIDSCNKPIFPLSIVYFLDEKISMCKTIVSTPSEYRYYMISILQMLFKDNGIPKIIRTNNRYLYYELYDLLDKLGIEFVLQKPSMLSQSFMTTINETLKEYFSMKPKKDRNGTDFIKKYEFINNLLLENFDKENVDEDEIFLLYTFISHCRINEMDDDEEISEDLSYNEEALVS